MSLLAILKKHTDYSLKSIEILFDEFSDDEFNLVVNGFLVRQPDGQSTPSKEERRGCSRC